MADNKIELIKYRRALIKASGKRLPRKRKPPVPLQPKAIEMEYYKSIMGLLSPMFTAIKEQLIPRLPELYAAKEKDRKIDSQRLDMPQVSSVFGSILTHTFEDISVGVAIESDTIEGLSDRFARRTSIFNKGQVDKQFRSVLGIDVIRAERWLEPQVTSFVEDNVSLITSIQSDYLKKVEQMVRFSAESGVSTDKLKKNIIESFGVPEKRAKLIARDQISKFNGKLTELRQTEAGVKEYDWSPSNDERVRERHRLSFLSQYAIDGKARFRWSDPPPVGNNGERLHPGQDYQCRCASLPVLEEFL